MVSLLRPPKPIALTRTAELRQLYSYAIEKYYCKQLAAPSAARLSCPSCSCLVLAKWFLLPLL